MILNQGRSNLTSLKCDIIMFQFLLHNIFVLLYNNNNKQTNKVLFCTKPSVNKRKRGKGMTMEERGKGEIEVGRCLR